MNAIDLGGLSCDRASPTLAALGEQLTAFWISFPKNSELPFGLGVTAWSKADALGLLVEQGIDYHVRAEQVDIKPGVTMDEIARHVLAKMGPIVVRGVWYPCLNVGFGAPPVR